MNFIGSKFCESCIDCPKILNSRFKKLSLEDCIYLEKPFSMEEIKDAIQNCGNENALGHDGFTFKFLKKLCIFYMQIS